MKTYNFLIGGFVNSYGSDTVEADTIEEAKQKILKDQLYLDVSLKGDNDVIDSLRIVEIHEVDEDGVIVKGGEMDSDIKIEGQPNCYDEGFEAGQKQTATAVSFMKAIVSINSKHASPELIEALNESDDFETCWTPHGYLISCVELLTDFEENDELNALIAWATERHRADFILLDMHGELHNELETHEWP